MSQSNLHTERLALRAFVTVDAPRVQQLAGEREIAATTLLIPHPYGDGVAEEWIAAMPDNVAAGRSYEYAITIRETGELIGATGFRLRSDWEQAELGYWIGVPYWGNGYATEAAREMVRFGFEELGLHRIFAAVFANNPASARVLQKAGLSYEGRHRGSVKKWDEFLDTDSYAILSSDGRPHLS